MKNIDENLYSRQIYTYGKDTMDKIVELRILIIGLRGLGLEIAKNLILAGPKEVSISDKNICKINDLTSNFYINESDVNNKTREDSCLKKLKALNPYVSVTIHKGFFKEDIKRFNLIIITEIMKLEELYEINYICRKNKIKFIYTLSLGLTGFLFNDFGDEHYVYDLNGEKKLKYNIIHIEDEKDKYKIILDIPNDESFELDVGDYVTFKNIKGLDFLNGNEPKKIVEVNKCFFKIEKNINSINGEYISDGIVEEYKVLKKFKFDSLKDNFIEPNKNFINIDLKKNKSNALLHCAFVCLHLYYSAFNEIPELNDLKKVDEIIKYSENYYKILKIKYETHLKFKERRNYFILEFDNDFKEYLVKVFRFCKAEINPICVFLGGIASQEAIKITGKYTPIHQWLKFDFFETIEKLPTNVNRNLLNCRYDDQIAIFGQEFQEKLGNLNVFMVGAGALGCEYIKNFGLMGVSCKNGTITITDNDNISLSNLNRQFLFHKNDIGENSSKSFCAKREALKINNNLNINDYQLLINDSTRNIFDDEFFEKQNLVISAVDNMSARKYIDKLCTFYNKIFIDSGTQGTNANSDIYYPNSTICFNDLKIQEKKEIPMCTLKNFPTKIEHCIEFSKNVFNELFEQHIRNLKLLLEDEQQFQNILNEINNLEELYLSIQIYKYIIDIINNPSQYSIINFAVFIFIYYFEYNIKVLLKELKDSFNKRPLPLEIIDLNEENTKLYFESFYKIFCDIINLKDNNYDIIKVKTEISKEKKNLVINTENLNSQELLNSFNKGIIERIKKDENKIREKIKEINPIKFEKDNDENYHINFILSFSNLRASNYFIEPSNFLTVKEIAGNIIPAIASTTAAVTGIACLQIYTLLLTDDIKYFKNISFNLAVSGFDLSTPEEKRTIINIPKTERSAAIQVIPREYTVWDKMDLYGPNLKIKNIIDDFKNKYNVEIDYINYKNDILFSNFKDEDEDEEEEDEDLDKSVEDLIKEKTKFNLNEKSKYVELEITGSIGNNEISTPTIRYILKRDICRQIKN